MKNTLLLFIIPLANIATSQSAFDIQGHRGCRGLYPKNTIPAFIEAVRLGVNTLEMDVVVSKDGQLVVSHDPYMSAEICSKPDGSDVTTADKFRIYDLNYSEIKKFDCGSRGNSKFPEQKKMAACKPLLGEVIDSVEKYIQQHHLQPVQYNIETKSTPAGDDLEHPKPEIFSNMLYALLKQKNVLHKCIIQSFDPRTLQIIHQQDALALTALLVFNTLGFEKNIALLGFNPTIYSPNFLLVNKKLIQNCHRQNIKIIPWTVNEPEKMRKMKTLGADGLISDYPDRAIKALR